MEVFGITGEELNEALDEIEDAAVKHDESALNLRMLARRLRRHLDRPGGSEKVIHRAVEISGEFLVDQSEKTPTNPTPPPEYFRIPRGE